MSEKKANHWVPRAYLRWFSADEKREKIWTFPSKTSQAERKPIDKVAVSFRLYIKENDGVKDTSLEDKLAHFEQGFGPNTWGKFKDHKVNLQNSDVRAFLGLAIATMHLRNPVERERLGAIDRQVARFIREKFQETGQTEAPLVDWKEDQIGHVTKAEIDKTLSGEKDADKDAWHRKVRYAHEIADLFMNMRWSVKFMSEPNFITSDNPIIIFNNQEQTRALRAPGTTVLFPLHPTILLQLDNKKEPDGQYFEINEHAVPNALMFRNRYQKIFSPREPTGVLKEIRPYLDEL
jgi:Protein of unknown function (DUF4238)